MNSLFRIQIGLPINPVSPWNSVSHIFPFHFEQNSSYSWSPSKYPTPEEPTLVLPRRVQEVFNLTGSIPFFALQASQGKRVSGFRCSAADQQKNPTHWVKVSHKMDCLSPVLASRFTPKRLKTHDLALPDI